MPDYESKFTYNVAQSPLAWPGGKRWMLPYILPEIARIPHTCYCEPFAGGISVLLAKPRSECEIVNDLNGDLVNFFRVCQENIDTLVAKLEWRLHSREELQAANQRMQSGEGDALQRAVDFFFVNRTCFRGVNHRAFQVSPNTAAASRSAKIEKLRALNARLDKVAVENLDWATCIANYDRPTTLFFIDPPYVQADVDIYNAWTLDNMNMLRERLATLKGKWLLTIDDSPANREVFSGCDITAFDRNNCLNSKRYGELLIRPQAAFLENASACPSDWRGHRSGAITDQLTFAL